MTDKLVAVRDLTKRFDGVTALEGVTFGVGAGTIVGVIGPNGAGKSTLLDILSGFQAADAGSIVIGGLQCGTLAAWKIARLGVARTFQDVKVSGSRTVLENVMLSHDGQTGERLRDLWRPRIVAAAQATLCVRSLQILEALDLTSIASSIAASTSYGQQKLLSMACCVARAANVYLLDEPLAGLAPKMRGVMVTTLQGLRKRGAVVIVVEHDIETLRGFVDRLMVMVAGRIVADGDALSVLARDEVRHALIG